MIDTLQNYQTMGSTLICTPFAKRNIDVVVKRGLAMVEQKIQLQELKLLSPFSVTHKGSFEAPLNPGDSIFVRGDSMTLPWAKDVYSVDGVEFVLVPENAVQLIKRNSPSFVGHFRSGEVAQSST